MIEVYLSEENTRLLKELEYGHATEPVKIPPVTHGSRPGEPPFWRQRELLGTMRRALSMLKNSSDEMSLHGAALSVFTLLHAHFASPNTLITPEPLSNPDEANHTEPFREPAGRAQSHDGPDIFLELQQDLGRALVSATLCTSDAADERHAVFIAEAGLASLSLLQYTTESVQLATCSLFHVAAYTDRHDKWTTKSAALFANCILDLQFRRNEAGGVIADILNSSIARSQLQSPSGSDSPASFVAHVPSPGPLRSVDDGQKFKAVFEWALKKADTKHIAQQWHLFARFLLSMAESHETTTKTKGLQLIKIFLAKCPATTLITTGIDRLLENTMFSVLQLLPPLTPEQDSATLLTAAYQALTDLAVKYPAVEGCSGRRRLLDKLFREGVLQSHRYASDHVKITTILLQSTARIVSLLGIFATKHLSNILGLLESVMCDSFTVEHPKLIMVASEVLVMVMRNCWPRMRTAQRTEQVLRILSVCWLNVQDSIAKEPRFLGRSDGSDMKRCIQKVVFQMRSMSKYDGGVIAGRLDIIGAQNHGLKELCMD